MTAQEHEPEYKTAKGVKASDELPIFYPIKPAWWNRRTLWNFLKAIFPFLNVALAGVVIWLAMRGDDVYFSSIFEVNINWWFVALALATVYIVLLLDSGRLWFVMKQTTGEGRFVLSLKTFTLTRFYHMLTPLMSGGHPYQVYYLHKHGFNMGKTTSVVVSNYIIGRIGFQLCTGLILAFLIFRIGDLDGGGIVTSSIIIGITYALVLTAVFLMVAFSHRLPKRLALLSILILSKIKIIKNKQKAESQTLETLWVYRVAMRKLLRRPWIFGGLSILSAAACFLYLFNIVWIYSALWGFPSFNTIALLLLGITLVDYTTGFIPIPGGTGGMELFFLAIFATLFGSPQVIVAVVLWKVVSYILPIVNGLPVLLLDSFKRDKKISTTDNI